MVGRDEYDNDGQMDNDPGRGFELHQLGDGPTLDRLVRLYGHGFWPMELHGMLHFAKQQPQRARDCVPFRKEQLPPG